MNSSTKTTTTQHQEINNKQHKQSNMQGNNHNQQAVQGRRPGMPNTISSERFCTFKIAPEERRYRDFEVEQGRILKEIMQKTNTKIEVTTTKDGALNFCIIGKEANLPVAKNLVLNDFQTSVTLTVTVPRSFFGRLLGPKGSRLASIQDETQTKITIPRKEEDSDIIKIVGLKNNAELAVRTIEKCAREFAGKTTEKVTVERIYKLFITGPFNENFKRWEEIGAKVSTSGIAPSNSDREPGHVDELTFTIIGETNAVQQVKDEILHIYEDKKKKCTTVNIEVKKAQHKYILGPNGHNLRELFAKTGVSVELPQESESETITLRGERSKLAPALAELYTQAHSETDEFFECETWLHKYLIGPKKTNLIDFKASGVDVKGLDDKIKLHGPPAEIEKIRDMFDSQLKILKQTIIKKDVKVEPRIHGYIIGRAGATVDQLREETGAYILVPKNDVTSELISLEGTVEAVSKAEEKINAIAKKYEASRKLVIDQQLHGSIIGRGGEKIRSIREKFSQVIFTFPDQGSNQDEITIVGPSDEVEECYKFLEELHQQLQVTNHQEKVYIKKDVIKYLADAQAAIRRIKIDHKVKIDLFINEGSLNSDNATEVKKDTSGPATSNNVQNESSENTEKQSKKSGKNKNKNVKPTPVETRKENGVSQTKDKKSTKGNNENYAVVIGRKEDVELAKTKFIKLLDELATSTELECKVPQKLRSQVGPKSKSYRQFLDEFQQKIVVIFPPSSANNAKPQPAKIAGDEPNIADTNGSSTTAGKKKKNATKDETNGTSQDRIEIVKIRGPKNIIKEAKERFDALVADSQDKMDKSFTLHTTVETAVVEKFLHADRTKLNKIRDSQNVKLNIPDRRTEQEVNCSIVGYEKNVRAALQQFKKFISDVASRQEETIEIYSGVHPRLIGAQGRAVKKLMEDFKIDIKFARQDDTNPHAVTLYGKLENIKAAKDHMFKLAEQHCKAMGGLISSTNFSKNNNNNDNEGQPDNGIKGKESGAINDEVDISASINSDGHSNEKNSQLQPTPHEAAANLGSS